MERSFAHICESGGARRSWLRGLAEVSKRYLMQVAGHNLGLLMRKLFGVGTPRGLQGACAALFGPIWGLVIWIGRGRRGGSYLVVFPRAVPSPQAIAQWC